MNPYKSPSAIEVSSPTWKVYAYLLSILSFAFFISYSLGSLDENLSNKLNSSGPLWRNWFFLCLGLFMLVFCMHANTNRSLESSDIGYIQRAVFRVLVGMISIFFSLVLFFIITLFLLSIRVLDIADLMSFLLEQRYYAIFCVSIWLILTVVAFIDILRFGLPSKQMH